MGIQSFGDKENNGVAQNWLESFIKGNLVHLVHLVHLVYFPCIVSVTPLYNDTNSISLLSYVST